MRSFLTSHTPLAPTTVSSNHARVRTCARVHDGLGFERDASSVRQENGRPTCSPRRRERGKNVETIAIFKQCNVFQPLPTCHTTAIVDTYRSLCRFLHELRINILVTCVPEERMRWGVKQECVQVLVASLQYKCRCNNIYHSPSLSVHSGTHNDADIETLLSMVVFSAARPPSAHGCTIAVHGSAPGAKTTCINIGGFSSWMRLYCSIACSLL